MLHKSTVCSMGESDVTQINCMFKLANSYIMLILPWVGPHALQLFIKSNNVLQYITVIEGACPAPCVFFFFSSWETREYHSVYLIDSYSVSCKNITLQYKSLQTSIITRGILKMICIAMWEHSRLLKYVNRSQLTITNYQLLTVAAVWLDLSSFTLSYGHVSSELVFAWICIIKKEPATNVEMFPDSDLRNIENSVVIITFQSFIFLPSL